MSATRILGQATRLARVASKRTSWRPSYLSVGVGAGCLVASLAAVSSYIVHNDAVPPQHEGESSIIETVRIKPEADEGMVLWSWGSNRYHVASSDTNARSLRIPHPVAHLSGVALRDLALHEKHGACVDAAGDVYQWGDGFFEHSADPRPRRPCRTLEGKKITDLALTATKVYALSKLTGRIYCLSGSKAQQGVSQPPRQSWWSLGWLWDKPTSVDCIELKSDAALVQNEKFVSISAGQDHLLALTSTGRSFCHAVSSLANSHGQLGLTQIAFPQIQSDGRQVPIELVPKALQDPLEFSTGYSRPSESKAEGMAESDIRFCDRLMEIRSLKGVKASALAAGARSSYLITADEGRILAWGANEFGQLGLGATFTVTTVPVPTEVVLSRAYPNGTALRCIDISAGGNVVYFVLDRLKPGDSIPAVDVLAAGMGQWGALGNGLYSQVQGAPVRVKAVSGVVEYDDAAAALKAIPPHAISVSPTGHAVLTLDTAFSPGQTGQGRDVLIWGLNSSYEHGNGKRVSGAVPSYMDALTGDTTERMMMRETKKKVRDLQGVVRGKKVAVRERAVAGWGCTAVYWRIV